MRVVIAGSRDATEPQLREALQRCRWINFVSAVVSGTARGADQFGEQWAEQNGLEVIRFPADWKALGRRAGPVRNQSMAENADGLIAVWDGESRGTRNMIETARKLGLQTFVFRTDTSSVEEYPATGDLGVRWLEAEERAGIKEYVGGLSRVNAEKGAGREQR